MKVITHKGPFVTVRSVQRSFSGKNQRPSADDVVGVFKAMEEDALGKMKGIEKTSVFFKALPSSVTEEKLERYNVGLTTYFNLFTELCSTSQISKEQFNKFFDKAEEKDALRKEYFIEPYDLDE